MRFLQQNVGYTKASFVVAETKPLLNGTMLYVTTILVSLLVIAFVVIVVLFCRLKNRTGVYIHNINSTVGLLSKKKLWTYTLRTAKFPHASEQRQHFFKLFIVLSTFRYRCRKGLKIMLDADTPFCFNGHIQVDVRYTVSTYFQIIHYLGTGLNFHN